MTDQENRSKAAEDLRQKAEALAREQAARTPEDRAALSTGEIRKTLHELRVHQIELEMQNEELRTAQARIEAGRDRYFDLYDLAPVGYCTLSEKGLILEVNLTTANLLGMTRGALIKQPISRLILKDDQDIYYLHRKQLLATGEPQECELRLIKPDGALIWAHLTGTAAQAEDGAPLCLVVISDITARKHAEAAKRAAELSQQMLTYIGQTPGKHEPIDLSEACRQNLSLLQAAIPKVITVNIDFPDSGPIVRANEGQINQVLANLITNAWESISNNQGSIGLTIRTVDQVSTTKHFPIDWQPQDIPYTCLEISDTGCGISKDDIVKIFDPFYTTKFTGRGMGLPITMGILKTHNGCITVDSEPESGTVFRVYLPVSIKKNPLHMKK